MSKQLKVGIVGLGLIGGSMARAYSAAGHAVLAHDIRAQSVEKALAESIQDAFEDPGYVYSGFAFGLGVERIALLKYHIDDMRLLYENDVRFLNQF